LLRQAAAVVDLLDFSFPAHDGFSGLMQWIAAARQVGRMGSVNGIVVMI
jgi:hypothetical protein